MAARYLTVRERVLRTLKDKLEKINEVGTTGWQVKIVKRSNDIIERVEDMPSILLVPGKEIPDFRGSHMTLRHMPLFILVATPPDSDNYDEPFNDAIGAIQQAFGYGPNNGGKVYDLWNADKEIYITELNNEPGYDVTILPEFSGGRLSYMIEYWHVANDTTRWDWDDQPIEKMNAQII